VPQSSEHRRRSAASPLHMGIGTDMGNRWNLLDKVIGRDSQAALPPISVDFADGL
jgi:hypothetical protein